MTVKAVNERSRVAAEERLPLLLQQLFDRLLEQYGPRGWWPAETPFEVCVGAILTQNTSWSNVEKAIVRLKAAGCLSISGIGSLTATELADLIRPAGYFRVKADRLQSFTCFVQQQYQGSLELLFAEPLPRCRERLLAVRGIGPETADSMVLYAGGKPSFVVDAYTRRIFSRLGLIQPDIGYEQLRHLFMDALPSDAALFNEYHALIVELGKQVCRTAPRCSSCCLADHCMRHLTDHGR